MSHFVRASAPHTELEEVVREIRRLRADCLGPKERRASMRDLEKVLARHEETLVTALPSLNNHVSLFDRLAFSLTRRVRADERRVRNAERLRSAYRKTLTRRAPSWLEEILWQQMEEVAEVFAKTRRVRTA